MKKNKNWLKQELSKQINILHTTISSGNYVSSVKRAEIMNLIDQLEGPEIAEEQAWGVIETYNHQHIAPAYVKVYKNYIQQGILPSEIVKQEIELSEPSAWKTIAKLYHPNEVYWGNVRDSYLESLEEPELPVVPQFVAEAIEKYKESDDSLGELLASVEHANIKYYHNMEKYRVDFDNLYEPSVDLCATIARAWIDGFVVEKQPKYLVKVNDQGSWLYLKSMSLYKDVERRTDLNSNLIGWKEKGIKFNNKEQAEGIAKFFGGEIEEITK